MGCRSVTFDPDLSSQCRFLTFGPTLSACRTVDLKAWSPGSPHLISWAEPGSLRLGRPSVILTEANVENC